MNNWATRPDLCDLKECISKLNNILTYRFFKCESQKAAGNDSCAVNCLLNATVDAEWTGMRSASGGQMTRFLSETLELANTTCEELWSPDKVEKVIERLSSEEARVNSPSNISALMCLRDWVYEDSGIKFHWNLDTIVETATSRRRHQAENNDAVVANSIVCLDNTVTEDNRISMNNYTDQLLWFVARKSEQSSDTL